MKKITIIIIFILNISNIEGQNDLKIINEDICINLETVNLSSSNKENLLKIQTDIANRTIQKHHKSISQIKTTFKKNNPELTSSEINTKLQAEMLFYLLDHCSKYLKLTQKTTVSHNYSNKASLKIITKDFNRFLEKNRNKSYKELNSIIDKNFIPFLKKHYDLIMKDYPEGPGSREFQDDIIASLMVNSEIYFKSTIHAQYSI